MNKITTSILQLAAALRAQNLDPEKAIEIGVHPLDWDALQNAIRRENEPISTPPQVKSDAGVFTLGGILFVRSTPPLDLKDPAVLERIARSVGNVD